MRTPVLSLVAIVAMMNFPALVAAKTIVGIGIAKSDDRVYTWFDDGTVTQGDSDNLQKYDLRRANPYKVATNKGATGGPSEIVAMSIAGNDHVFTWYKDGTCSEGTSTDLGIYQVRLPVNHYDEPMSAVVGIGIAGSDDRVFVWYNDQTRSVGTTRDFQKYEKPKHYDLLSDPMNPGTQFTPADIVEIDIAKDDRVYTWFRNGIHSSGTSSQLGKTDVGAYIRSHVLYNSFSPPGNSNPVLQTLETPPIGGIAPATTYCGGHDASVAAGPHYLAISDTYWLKFIDRVSGKTLDLGPVGNQIDATNSCAGTISGENFFSAFFDPTSDVYVNNNVGFRRKCDDPNFPPTNNTDENNVDRKFCITGHGASLYDLRIIFDPMRQRFFITAQVRNGGLLPVTPGDTNSPPSGACASFHGPKGAVVWTPDATICSMPRHHKLLAVSKSEDPRDGFHQYLITENTIADWPDVAVNGSRVILSNLGPVEEPPTWPTEIGVVQVLDTNGVTNGSPHPAYFEYFPKDLDGLRAVLAPTHHGHTQGLTFLLSDTGRLAIYGIPDHPDPWNAPALLVTHEFGTSRKGPSARGAVYRDGTLFFVDSTGSAKDGAKPLSTGSTVQNGVRVVSVHVSPSGQTLNSSVDIDETFNPPDSSLSFDDPAIEVNKNGTVVIGYHVELRNWHDRVTIAQARLWTSGKSPGTEVSISPGTASGTVLSCMPCRHKNDYATVVMDPSDDTSFWTALPYTSAGSVETAITKVKP
jgi:hypothetical protein